jgi:hypothetical protein
MMITPYVRGVAAARAYDLREEAARARRIAAAWAYKRSARRWTWHT